MTTETETETVLPSHAHPASPLPRFEQYISFSQYDALQTCARQWYLEKVARVPSAPKQPLIQGDAVHQAIEAHFRARLGAPFVYGAPVDPAPLAATFARVLDERLAKDDPHGWLAHERAAMLARGTAVVETFARRVAPLLDPLAVEERFEFALPDDYSVGVTGKIDLIAWHYARREQPPRRVMLDWKTGAKAKGPGWEHTSPQASIYELALSRDARLRVHLPIARTVFVFFPHAADGTCGVDSRFTSRKLDMLPAVSRMLATAAERMRQLRRTPLEDVPGVTVRRAGLCAYCAVRGACSIGQENLRISGRAAVVPAVA